MKPGRPCAVTLSNRRSSPRTRESSGDAAAVRINSRGSARINAEIGADDDCNTVPVLKSEWQCAGVRRHWQAGVYPRRTTRGGGLPMVGFAVALPTLHLRCAMGA